MTQREIARTAKYDKLINQKVTLKVVLEKLNEELDEAVQEVSYNKDAVEYAAQDMVHEALNLDDVSDSEFQSAADDYRRAKEDADDFQSQIEEKEEKLAKVEKQLKRFKKKKKTA